MPFQIKLENDSLKRTWTKLNCFFLLGVEVLDIGLGER